MFHKFILSLFVVLLTGIIPVTGQKNYYYYKGQKQPLTPLEDKVIITIPGHDNPIKLSSDIQLITDYSNESQTIGVYEISEKIHKKPKLAKIPKKALIEPVYINENGAELPPTGYFHIKLKKPEDIKLLKDIAKKYKLIIEGEDSCMRLWYGLRRAPNCKGLSLDIINEIYETGKFEYCSPEFYGVIKYDV